MDINELKKLINEEVKKIKLQEGVGMVPNPSDKYIVFLKTLTSIPSRELYNKYKIRGLDGIINSIKYMQTFSKVLEQATPIDITSPEGEKQLLSLAAESKVENDVIQTLEDLSMKDEYQQMIENFMKNIVSNSPTASPTDPTKISPEPQLPTTNPGRKIK